MSTAEAPLNRKLEDSKAIQPYKWTLHDFDVGRKLGRGKFGRVYLVRVKTTNFICALKSMKKSELVSFHAENLLQREYEIHKSLIHPNIAQLYGYFDDSKRVYLLVEYVPGGELYGHLQKAGHFDDHRAAKYLVQVASALDYLHSRNVVHRDLKPENLLLDSKDNIKLSDFGWSIHTRAARNTVCGTLDYLPPEMIERQPHGYQVDIWALGILLYEFLVGKPPFEERQVNDTYRRIRDVNLKIPSFVDPRAANLITRLLQRKPERRMPLAQLPNHSWVKHNINAT